MQLAFTRRAALSARPGVRAARPARAAVKPMAFKVTLKTPSGAWIRRADGARRWDQGCSAHADVQSWPPTQQPPFGSTTDAAALFAPPCAGDKTIEVGPDTYILDAAEVRAA